MNPDDKALLSVLLDNEANPDEVTQALALLDRKPELMAYLERHQWVRAHWQKEYAGPQLDLRAGIWDKISAEATASEAGLVDELALRREARGLSRVLHSTESTPDQPISETVEAQGVAANSAEPASSATLSQAEGAHADDQAVESVAAIRDGATRQKRWWQPVAQLAVAASVCFGVVGLWYIDQPTNPQTPTTLAPTVNLASNTSSNANNVSNVSETETDASFDVPFNEAVAGSQTAVASQLAASLNTRATVASAGRLGVEQASSSVFPSLVLGQNVGAQFSGSQAPTNAAEPLQFVSLDSLAAKERARLQSYYMMHTGNSAMMQPIQGMQLVRIVDTPPSPQLRSVNGQ